MNGPDHYRESERLIASVVDEDGDLSGITDVLSAQTLLLADVHARLALAAATAMAACDAYGGMHWADFHAWDQAVGVAVSEDNPQRSAKSAL